MQINLPLTKLLVEGNICFYIILDESGNIRFANNLFIQTIAKQETVLENTPFVHFLQEPDKVTFEQLLKTIIKTKDSIHHTDLAHTTISKKSLIIKWDIINKTSGKEVEVHC